MARLVFMGTPEFAVPALRALVERHQVAGVVTQPDRPAGRGRAMAVSPVKAAALALRLQVFQPEALRAPEAIAHLARWQPELIVVAAFGQILRPSVLALPQHGCLNLHASLLPRYRGAAPIPAAILAGEQTAGVTLMQMDEGLDTGPILAQAELPIAADETTGSLTAKLADLGAGLLIEKLPAWLDGALQPRPQDHLQATYCRPLQKADGQLDWGRPAVQLDRQVRACDPWPGAYTAWQGQRLKFLRTRPWPARQAAGTAGQVVRLEAGVGVVTGQGLLELLEVQLAGKKPMAGELFALGQRGLIGSRLGA